MAPGFDTAPLEPRERFAVYRAAVTGAFYPMTPQESSSHASEEFRVQLEARQLASAAVVECRATPHPVARTRQNISSRASGCYFIFEQLGRSPVLLQAEGCSATRVAAGDLVIGDADRPFVTPESGHYHHRFWLLPKSSLDPVLPGAAALLRNPIKLAGDEGIGALLSAQLKMLCAQADHPDISDNAAITHNLSHLLSIALGASSQEEPQRLAVAHARYQQAIGYIEREFSDPRLTPQRVAARLGISVRTLHSVFEGSGASFAEHVTQRRLQASRAALLNPATRQQSLAAIAFACGFNDVSTFHRAFRRAYGVSPSELRPKS
ncbi:MAG TPA: helix-turn-helix domain-containing protein [Allosphingosinicella sp.]|nr:helix-turn-helix domain-containing protein [Allosphingosinicella sp.]